MDKRVAISTLGCKVNQYESAVLAGAFHQRGYRVVEFATAADVYIINTCTVTRLGDRKSRQLIRRATRTNPNALIVVTGCYAQVAPAEIMAIPGVDLVVGTQDRTKLVDLVETAEKGREPVNLVTDLAGRDLFEEDEALPWQERTRAFLKIQDGCNNYCTYCIVPYARGKLRSRKPEEVVRLAGKLAAAGYKEVVLTGIHTGSYGQDLPYDITLAGLLRRLEQVDGLARIRLSSIEPHDITLELVEVLAASPLFCRHLHVPLQSGDEFVLQKMGRRYTAWEFARLAEVLQENIAGLGLTTDVIVGFPGESEEAFDNTYGLVKKCRFSKLHVFKYSPRPGTPAAAFNEQVEAGLKEKRSRDLITLGRELEHNFAASLSGQVLSVLVERQCPKDVDFYEGLADNYVRVLFPGQERLVGSIVQVLVESIDGTTIKGRII